MAVPGPPGCGGRADVSLPMAALWQRFQQQELTETGLTVPHPGAPSPRPLGWEHKGVSPSYPQGEGGSGDGGTHSRSRGRPVELALELGASYKPRALPALLPFAMLSHLGNPCVPHLGFHLFLGTRSTESDFASPRQT